MAHASRESHGNPTAIRQPGMAHASRESHGVDESRRLCDQQETRGHSSVAQIEDGAGGARNRKIKRRGLKEVQGVNGSNAEHKGGKDATINVRRSRRLEQAEQVATSDPWEANRTQLRRSKRGRQSSDAAEDDKSSSADTSAHAPGAPQRGQEEENFIDPQRQVELGQGRVPESGGRGGLLARQDLNGKRGVRPQESERVDGQRHHSLPEGLPDFDEEDPLTQVKGASTAVWAAPPPPSAGTKKGRRAARGQEQGGSSGQTAPAVETVHEALVAEGAAAEATREAQRPTLTLQGVPRGQRQISLDQEVEEVSLPPGVEDIDAGSDMEFDPGYMNQYYQNLRSLDRKYPVQPVLDNEGLLLPCSRSTRRRAIVWMMNICRQGDVEGEAMFMAVQLLDRALLRMQDMTKRDMEKIVTVCITVATKFVCEEHIHPGEMARQWDNIYTKQELVSSEVVLLGLLEYRIVCASSIQFAPRYCLAAGFNKDSCPKAFHLVHYLLELALLEYDFVPFSASLKAASAVNLAAQTLKTSGLFRPGWGAQCLFYTGHAPPELEECARMLLERQARADFDLPDADVVVAKYNTRGYYYASAVPAMNPRELTF